MFLRGRLFPIVCAILFLLAPAQQSFSAKAPRVTHVGLAAPDVLSVSIRDGEIRLGRPGPYKAQAGDTIKADNFPHRWLMRNGKAVGAIGGKNKDIFLPFDKVPKGSLDPSSLQSAQNFRLTSADDPACKAGLVPQAVHRKSRPHNMGQIAPWKFDAVLTHTLYLKLPQPLREGRTYTLAFPGLNLQPHRFVMDSNRLVSESIHVSQIGFKPDDPAKVAFVSCWMGDGGGITYPAGMPFYIADAKKGGVVYKGTLALSKAAADRTEDVYKRNYNGTDVYIADFTSFNRPGSYVVVVPGIGCSLPFKMDPGVWREPFRTSVRGLYHQRSGITLGPPYTGFKRPRDFHPDDGLKVYSSRTQIIDTGNGPLGYDVEPTNFRNLVKGRTDQIVPNAWGGYHDAGDWDRRIQHLVAARNLLDLVEMFPQFSAKVDLNIPKSDAKLPDMLTEALFGLDCYRRMQTEDGGIRGGIESEEHPRCGETSWHESLTVMAYAPDAWSSYWYAGTAARASRVLQSYNPGLAREYRESALRAAEWAEGAGESSAEPLSIWARLLIRLGITIGLVAACGWLFFCKAPRLHGRRRRLLRAFCLLAIPLSIWRCAAAFANPGYPVDLHRNHLVRDGRNYAAAELFRLTGDARWNEAFNATTKLDQPDAVIFQWGSHDQSEAAWVYARTENGQIDKSLRRRCQESILRSADERLGVCEATGFRWTKYPWRPFGISVPAVPDGISLIWAHHLSGEGKYLKGIVLATQFGAGANPTNTCFTIGVGHRYPKHPLHLDSRLSGQPAPEGITVFGPMDVNAEYFEGDWGRKLLAPHCYPALETWPSVESHMDVFWNALLCEFTIHDTIAPNLFFWGYLAAR